MLLNDVTIGDESPTHRVLISEMPRQCLLHPGLTLTTHLVMCILISLVRMITGEVIQQRCWFRINLYRKHEKLQGREL
jgi:hypothetical protein